MAKKNPPTPKDTEAASATTSAPSATVPTSGPSAAMIALFAKPQVDMTKLVRRNMPMLVKPDSVPVGGAVTGEIIAIVNSPVSTVKGKLIWLKHVSGTEFTFPCTGVIRNALCPGISGDKELEAALNKEVGKQFVAVRQADKPSTKYGGKNMFMFDVFTTNK